MSWLDFTVSSKWNVSPSLFVVFAFFFVGAAAEELGYTAYATDALQTRTTALGTALTIGPIWAMWHLPSMIQVGQGLQLIVWGLVATAAFRVLWIWIYNNASRSAFAVILAHAVFNTARTAFPGGRTAFEYGNGFVTYSTIIVAAVVAVVMWGPATLSDFLLKTRTTNA
jgi:membrane protease YdiL (CAAX protease family)